MCLCIISLKFDLPVVFVSQWCCHAHKAFANPPSGVEWNVLTGREEVSGILTMELPGLQIVAKSTTFLVFSWLRMNACMTKGFEIIWQKVTILPTDHLINSFDLQTTNRNIIVKLLCDVGKYKPWLSSSKLPTWPAKVHASRVDDFHLWPCHFGLCCNNNKLFLPLN